MAKEKSLQTNAHWRWQAACFLLFLAFLGAAGWAIYTQRSFERIVEQRINEYPLIDPARNFIVQEDFIVNIQPLRERLYAMVAREEEANGLDISLYFEFLNTGANVQVNNTLRVWPASLPKVPMAMVVMNRIEDGTWSLDTNLALRQEHKDSGWGDLWERPTGALFTVEKLLFEMLAESDNTAYQIFYSYISDEELNGIIAELGLEEMFSEDGFVSAKEYSRIFRSLYTSSFLRRENSERLLEWLAQSDFEDFLAGGIPEDISFSHKFGIDTEKNSYIDSGIVYGPGRPYLISVAVQGTGAEGEESRVEAFMQEVSQEIYDYVISRQKMR